MSVIDNPEIRERSFFEHPKLKEFIAAGILSKRIADNALLVYLHLIEVQNWFDVESVIITEKQCILLKGRRTEKSEAVEYVLPVSSDVSFSTEDMNNLIDIACEYGCEDECLLLAFVDNSSSTVFYKITKGLIPPNKPSQKELLKMNKIPEWNEQKGKWKM